MDALHVLRFSVRDLWDEFGLLILLNMLWCLTAVLPVIPLLVLSTADLWEVLALCLALLPPVPVATGALCFVTNQVSRGKPVGFGTFLTGLRRYWLKSLTVALVNLVVLVLIAANLRFYSATLRGDWTKLAFSVWLMVGACWLLVQLYWFPMLLELESEKAFTALRSALALVIITPGFSLTVGLLLTLLGVLCAVLSVPLVLFAASLFLLVANHATRSRLAYAQKKPYQPGMPGAG